MQNGWQNVSALSSLPFCRGVKLLNDWRELTRVLIPGAVACGAKLQATFDLRVTHYVSHYNTEKAKYAFDQGIRVVQPRWLEKSDHYWERCVIGVFSFLRVGSRTSSGRLTA